MARNYFGGNDAMDVLQAGQAGWDDTQGRFDGIMRKRAAYRAGPMLARGDYAGAAQEYGAMGLDEQALAARGAQSKVDETNYQHGKDAREEQRAAIERRVGALKQTTGYARQIAAEDLPKRKDFIIQSLMHQGQANGDDYGELIQKIQALPPEYFTDEHLASFDGKMDEYVGVALGRGGYGSFNKTNNTFETLREPDKTPPPQGFQYDDNGNLSLIPGYVPGKAAIAAATRAPPRPRASGGGASLPPPPAGWSPRQ